VNGKENLPQPTTDGNKMKKISVITEVKIFSFLM
jgi:hypothetical protein